METHAFVDFISASFGTTKPDFSELKQANGLLLETNNKTSWKKSFLGLDFWDHVSFRVPRPIHRPMHRSMYRSILNRLSTDMRPTCRSTVGRESTDVLFEFLLMSADVSTVTISVGYRFTTGGISVNDRPICRPILWYHQIYRPIVGRYHGS